MTSRNRRPARKPPAPTSNTPPAEASDVQSRSPETAAEHPPRPATVSETLDRVDGAWQGFRALADAFPRERIDEHIDRGWTRKQMLAHIAAWHDMTTDRLLAFVKTGERQPLAVEDDMFNSRVARAAVGRTSGEVFDALDSSLRRLRRQISLLEDEQLGEHDGWPAAVIAGNSYEHYAEHRADLELPFESDVGGHVSSAP